MIEKGGERMNRTKNFFLIIMTLMVSFMLIGCSAEATTETAKSGPEAVVKEEAPKVEEVVETKVPEEAAVAEEPIVEETVVEEPADAFEPITPIQAEERQVAEEIAKIKGISAQEVIKVTTENTKKLYGTKNNCKLTQLGQILDKRHKETKKPNWHF